MWTAIIIVGLAIAMMLGPIMMMQPSKRQRRLAKLRASAEAEGLKIRMTVMPDKSVRAGEEVAVYCRSWPGKKGIKQTWLLARQPFSHGLHFAEEWDWIGRDRAPLAWQEVIRTALARAPRGVLAVEASPQALGAYWLEQIGDREPPEATAELAGWLGALTEALPQQLPSRPQQTLDSAPEDAHD